MYSHATHKTGRTHRTHRTNASYLSFSGFTDMSRKTVMVGRWAGVLARILKNVSIRAVAYCPVRGGSIWFDGSARGRPEQLLLWLLSSNVQIGSTPLRVSASLAAGGAAEKAALIFRKHDLNDDNSLDREEMLAALDEMGVLHGIKAKHIGGFGALTRVLERHAEGDRTVLQLLLMWVGRFNQDACFPALPSAGRFLDSEFKKADWVSGHGPARVYR